MVIAALTRAQSVSTWENTSPTGDCDSYFLVDYYAAFMFLWLALTNFLFDNVFL